jgi:hypothetical protein
MLKHNLGEYKLKDDHEAETAIDAMPNDKGQEHYHQRTEKFVLRYYKCLSCGGEFVRTISVATQILTALIRVDNKESKICISNTMA